MGLELETSLERYQRHVAQQAAAAEEREQKKAEELAFREAATRSRNASVAVVMKSPLEQLNDIYKASHEAEKAQAMQARKEQRDTSKDPRNVPAWLIDKLPPGDALRKQAALMTVNPEDYE